MIKLIKAFSISKNEVKVLYSHESTEFVVTWNNIHPETGNEESFDLQIDCLSSREEFSMRIEDCIRNGEDCKDFNLYIAIRDTFDSSDCESLVEEEIDSFEITSSSYDPDMGGVVTVELNGEESEFIVQLAGGEYLGQMGCWILHESQEGDFDFDETPFEEFSGDIIKAGENSYKVYVNELMDEEVEEGETFEFYTSKEQQNCSATSTSEITVEKSNNGRFRSYLEGSGFTQPNDYSMMPDFKGPIYYDDEDDYSENNTDDSLIEEN